MKSFPCSSEQTSLFSELPSLYFPHRTHFQIMTSTDGWFTNCFLFVDATHLECPCVISVQANKMVAVCCRVSGKMYFSDVGDGLPGVEVVN